MGHKASPLEGSNGLLEKGTESQTNDTQSPTRTSAVVRCKEHRNIAQVARDSEAALLQRQGSGEASTVQNKEDTFFHENSGPALGKGDDPQEAVDHKNPEPQCSSDLLLTVVRDADAAVEEEATVVSSHQAPTANSCPPTNLSDAERPEPEGEVATHCTLLQTQDRMVVQRVAQSEGDSLETPLLAQELHQCALTSTPTAAPAHDPSVWSEDSQEDRDLELLACGLINEVISAATQEVLGVMEKSHPTSSSASLASGGRGSPPGDHHPLASSLQAGHQSREAVQNGEQGIANGCFQHSDGAHQTNGALQSTSSLNTKSKGDSGGTLTEDSACSVCHSSDAASSEDLHSKVEAAQETHFSESEVATAPQLAETTTTAAAVTSLAGMEENSVEAMCEIKRLNGIGLLGNGALGTCELETDQSGGETPVFEWTDEQ